MNSRESAAFDESLMLANANAIKESRAMAMGIPGSASPSSAAFPYGATAAGTSGDLHASRGKKRRRKEDSSEREESEDNVAHTAAANQSTSTTHSGKEGMDVVKEEDETVEEDYTTTTQAHTGLEAVKDTIEAYKEREDAQQKQDAEASAHQEQDHAEGEDIPQEIEVEEAQEVYDEAGDESLSLAQPAKKRRKRRGIGMTATARTKKAALAAKARQQLQAIKVDEDNSLLEGSNGLESDAVPDTPIETDEQNQRKRKRMDGGEEEM
jgi:hypothetical protein